MHPYISLIILSYNNWHLTNACLNTLCDSFEEPHLDQEIEIIIVDNGSNDETRQAIKEWSKIRSFPGIQLRLVMLEENLGYPSGINVGLAHCQGSIIGVLNNDLVFPRGWLSPLVNLLETDKLIGFAAPYLSLAPSIQNLQKNFASFTEMQDFASSFTKANAKKLISTNRIVGACLVFRRDLLHSIGGNDFWYGIGNFDDDDWCMRARIAGYKIVVCGRSFVQHIGHAAFRLEPTRLYSSLAANTDKFERKYQVLSTEANERNEAIKQTKFDRGKHFIPLQINEYSSKDIPYYNRTSDLRRLLFCVDWTNSESQWTRSLLALLPVSEKIELCFWMPKSLFDVHSINAQIHRAIDPLPINFQAKEITFTTFQDDVPYVDTLRILCSTDAVIKVPNDFVNRYIIRLAQQIGVNIQ
ncbi:MAG: glycosyl transferase family 2 [Bacilli bacterium]|nr:glycosyl transferase family 2 [Bacilli bacterium]